MVIRTASLLSLALLFSSAADARMYRWVDDNGMTVYSQSPPPSGEATEIKVNTSTAAPNAKAAADAQPKQAAEPEKKESGPTKAEIEESNRIKAENCKAASSNLNLYENLGNKLVKTPDGLYKRLTEEERQQKIQESKDVMSEFCDK
ncbi:MAG: DUF4124 domain-containing protein [Sedimenticola sp.]|nr:DUF4124 domain-containing protein [Sedimenticola sp.]